MPWLMLVLQVFLLMCAPLPQGSYIGVTVGRNAGLSMGLMLVLYALSDLLLLLLIRAAVRRVRLPGRLRRWVERTAPSAEALTRGPAALPALVATGFASLSTIGVIAGLCPTRSVRVMVAGLMGDLVKFIGTVALGGVLTSILPFPGATWAVLVAVPLLTSVVAMVGRACRSWLRSLHAPVMRVTGANPC